MEHNEEDDDVKLARASAGLLADLESNLPKILWKPSKTNASHGRVHSRVRRKDLDYIINLIEPFQGEPHLLDARLKAILPPIVDAYLESLLNPTLPKVGSHIALQTALASILYTLCKVRGAKVIVGFLNNEPRYLEPILSALEDVTSTVDGEKVDWKVPYVLLLWLSHLLLTPFDLASISGKPALESNHTRVQLPSALPPVAQRIVHLGTSYLAASTKAQDAAAAMLVRLATRPDMQKLQVADTLTDYAIGEISPSADIPTTIYQQLGPLRFLAGIATSADLGHLIPRVYRTCQKLAEDPTLSPVSTNAVGKKLTVKIFRNIAILTLRSAAVSGPLLSFLETTGVLEDVIDHLLQSLGDRDTPVRYAAAKAISLIISELEPEMGHEVIQAVLDTFKEDIPRSASAIDYQTVNALKWHGLTLTLSHALFKRSASPSQLPDILDALVSALNFEQRTATGSSIGTNVRDAANFGIWSLSRRYTSEELLSVECPTLRFQCSTSEQISVIQAMAVQLLLAACLDPAGNIRRGSSAALQELIGRHPNKVIEGISIVQAVDYQAVGLRKRGLIDVANKAASLHHSYWEALIGGLIAWRGLRSVDVPSREAAAQSLANLVFIGKPNDGLAFVSERLLSELSGSAVPDIESLHGLVTSLSNLLGVSHGIGTDQTEHASLLHRRCWRQIHSRGVLRVDFNPRTLKSELPVAVAKVVANVCRNEVAILHRDDFTKHENFDEIENVVHRLLVRHDDPILLVIPDMTKQLHRLRRLTSEPLGCIDIPTLSQAVTADGAKSTLSGAGRAIALGSVALDHNNGLAGANVALAISTLTSLVTATNVDWRTIGLRALDLALQDFDTTSETDPESLANIVQAIHAGLTDYTIDERGDIGSLVRLQALTCASSLLTLTQNLPALALALTNTQTQLLQADILRLSLEKLDRVRARAALIRSHNLPEPYNALQTPSSPSSATYLSSALAPLFNATTLPSAQRALLEGAISCAGASSESLLRVARDVLVRGMRDVGLGHLHALLSTYAAILADLIAPSAPNANANNLLLPALDLLSFLLDMGVPQRLATTNPPSLTTPSNPNDPPVPAFKWRSLLSTVQKSHHKSADVPRLLAAVGVYRSLAEVEAIRGEVLKKLLGMLGGNPYPRVRVGVAEVLFGVGVQDGVVDLEEMKGVNWAEKPLGVEGKGVLEGVRGEFLGG